MKPYILHVEGRFFHQIASFKNSKQSTIKILDNFKQPGLLKKKKKATTSNHFALT